MVVVHEFGHFAVAKICGVRVEAFSVGFGPRLFGIKYGDTDYKVCLLPLGGFVKMTGENPGEEQPADDPGAFSSHPRWQRMLIGVAGPVANFILAFVLWCSTSAGSTKFPPRCKDDEDRVGDAGFARGGGWLEAGDWSANSNGRESDLGTGLCAHVAGPEQTVPVTVERDGKTVQTSMRCRARCERRTIWRASLPQYMPGPIHDSDRDGGFARGSRPDCSAATRLSRSTAIPSTRVTRCWITCSGQGQADNADGRAQRRDTGADRGPARAGSNGWRLGFMAVPVPIRLIAVPLKMAVAKSAHFCAEARC